MFLGGALCCGEEGRCWWMEVFGLGCFGVEVIERRIGLIGAGGLIG